MDINSNTPRNKYVVPWSPRLYRQVLSPGASDTGLCRHELSPGASGAAVFAGISAVTKCGYNASVLVT